jgi:peptidoglycan-associated lipoprotein
MRIFRLTLIALGGLALAGCPKKPTVIPEGTAPTETGASTEGAGTGPGIATQDVGAEERARREAEAAGKIVYFDYDRAEIKPEFVPVIAASAKYLNGAQVRKVRLEGHSDERGSREYNIGLGERRAQSVRRALMLQGVRESQITTVSYGEERPAVQGSDESAYAKNRRVELSYGR